MKRIEVTVSPKGESRIETFGFEGQSCQDATGKLEAALGLKQSATLKQEYFQTEIQQPQQQETE